MSDVSLRDAYDSIAAGFARRFADVPADLVPAMEEVSLLIGSSGRLLDVGCGHGRDLAWFAARGHPVIGLDLSHKMLLHTTQRDRLVEADMSHLPFSRATLDGIWCNASLLHLPKVGAGTAVAEFRRVLRKSGVLMVSVQQGQHDGPRHSDLWNVSRHFSDYECDEMAALFERNGFKVRRQAVSELPNVTWIQTLGRAAGAA